jgi:hypothetical protein
LILVEKLISGLLKGFGKRGNLCKSSVEENEGKIEEGIFESLFLFLSLL